MGRRKSVGEKSKKDQRCLPAAGGSGPVPRVCLHSLGRLLLSTARHKQFGLWRCAVCPCSNRSVPAHVFTRHVPDSLSARGTAANIALKDNERHSLHLVQGPSTRTVELFSTVRSSLVLLPTQVAGNAKKGDRGEEFRDHKGMPAARFTRAVAAGLAVAAIIVRGLRAHAPALGFGVPAAGSDGTHTDRVRGSAAEGLRVHRQIPSAGADQEEHEGGNASRAWRMHGTACQRTASPVDSPN